jgi:hypothetical protein
MLKIQQVKTKEAQKSQTRKVVIYDDNFEMNLMITLESWYWRDRLIIKGEKNLKKLWEVWVSKISYDKKIYNMWKFEIYKNLIIENFYKNEKNVSTYYTITNFLDKLVEELKNYEEKNL